MLEIAVGLFAVGAAGGLIMAAKVLKDEFAPWALSLLHAALGAAGLVIVCLAVLRATTDLGLIPVALVILVIAAFGGFFLASFHVRKAHPPKPVVLIHAGVAVVGFLLLAGSVFSLI